MLRHHSDSFKFSAHTQQSSPINICQFVHLSPYSFTYSPKPHATAESRRIASSYPSQLHAVVVTRGGEGLDTRPLVLLCAHQCDQCVCCICPCVCVRLCDQCVCCICPCVCVRLCDQCVSASVHVCLCLSVLHVSLCQHVSMSTTLAAYICHLGQLHMCHVVTIAIAPQSQALPDLQ